MSEVEQRANVNHLLKLHFRLRRHECQEFAGFEFSEASNVKELVENVSGGEGNVATGRGVFWRYLSTFQLEQTTCYKGLQIW